MALSQFSNALIISALSFIHSCIHFISSLGISQSKTKRYSDDERHASLKDTSFAHLYLAIFLDEMRV